jgi:Cupin-like domain
MRPLASIPRCPAPTRDDFYRTFGRSETPVIFSDVVPRWPASGKWSFDWFRDRHAALPVPIEHVSYRPSRRRHRAERVGVIEQGTMGAYIDDVRARGGDAGYLISNGIFRHAPALLDDVSFPAYADAPSLAERSFFMGTDGAFTQLHNDRAHNLHAVITGRKRWVLYAPERSRQLRPAVVTWNWVMSGVDMAPLGGDPQKLPGETPPDYDFVLEAAEMLFIPYGWWHRVTTLGPTIATNLWWWTWPMLARRGPTLVPSWLDAKLRAGWDEKKGRLKAWSGRLRPKIATALR